jgi:hypothetical protein
VTKPTLIPIEEPREVTGGGGVNESLIKFFHKNPVYVPRSKLQAKIKTLQEGDEHMNK